MGHLKAKKYNDTVNVSVYFIATVYCSLSRRPSTWNEHKKTFAHEVRATQLEYGFWSVTKNTV